MESLSFTSDVRERPLAVDAELQVDSFTRSRNLVQGWNAESFPVMLSDIFQGMESIESGLLDMPRKSIISTQRLVDDTNCGSDKSSISVPIITPDASLAIDSSFSNLAAEISANKLEQTSLKNMKLVTSRESSKCDQFSVENSLFSQDPALSIKRVRLENFGPQIPVCLVHGCNKDLSSLKEYHRKHKVCDIHSKTSVVVVNGANQRFCQQCSRFHILAEFDEGKRSCRKRLVDHNERRRRPQLDTQFGAMLFNTDFFSWQCNEPNSHIRPLKLQKGTTQISNSVAPQAFGPWQYPLETSLNSPLLAVELSGSYTSFAHSLLSTQSQSLLINSEIPALANQKTRQPLEEITSSYSEARIPDASVSLSFETPRNEPEGARTANTVDLLQLSLHLQRVQEQQKISAPENVIFTS